MKELEIPIHFHNYKLLKDNEFVLDGSYIYFVQGPNKVGKTSFLKALMSLQVANDDTPAKVTRGESEGYYEATIPDKDGNMVTIRHEFTDTDKGKFIAIKDDGTKVSKVTEIREMFDYTPISVHEFFNMGRTAEGRRKQRDIILKLLPEKDMEEFNSFDFQESHYYDQRTEANRVRDQAKVNADSLEVDPEAEKYMDKKEEAEKLIKQYDNALILMREKTQNDKDLVQIDISIAELEEELKQEKDRRAAYLKQNKQIEKVLGDLKDSDMQTVQDKIAKGNSILSIIQKTTGIIEMKEKFLKQYKDYDKTSKKLDKEIEICRQKKSEIVAKNELPIEDISFENGYLTINGFKFDENQVCESDAVIILANILAKINKGPIQVIGDASILDKEKLEMLNDIAIKNNKVMFVDEVVRDAESMVVTGYENIALADFKDQIDKVAKGRKKKSVTPEIDKIEVSEETTPSEPAKEQDVEEPGQDDSKEPSGEDSVKPLF